MRITLGANSNQYEQENIRERGEVRNKSKSEDQHKWTRQLVYRGSVQKDLLPIEEAIKAVSIPTLSLSQLVT
jgi:ribosomal protein S4